MTFRRKFPVIALGVVSLTAPLAVAGPGNAATADARPTAAQSTPAALRGAVRAVSPVEDSRLTDATGRPSAALSALPARASGTAGPAAGQGFATRALTGKRFSSLGLSWAKDSQVDAGLTARARVHRNGVWEGWRNVPLELEEGVSEEAKRAGAPAFYTDDADGVQLRLNSPSGRLPQDLRLSLIDPATGTTAGAVARENQAPSARRAPAARTAPAATSAAQPVVNPRQAWGADENLADAGYKTQATIKAALVHHTVVGNNSYTQEQVPQIINGIYVHHIKNLGYGDFPYHFVVDRFGGIWEGRKGSVDMRPDNTAVPAVLGGHASGFNRNTFGIATLGNFEPNNAEGGENTGPDPRPSEAMIDGLADLLAWKGGQYGLDPAGTVQLTSAGGGGTNPHPTGKVLTVPVISSHRDVNATACPGGTLYEALPALRLKVAERLG